MESEATFTINQSLRENTHCFCYRVYWKNNYTVDTNLWKSTSFYNFKDAKAFAKSMWKKYKQHKLKPYILETIVRSDYFKEELFYSLKIVDKEKYEYNYVRKVW